MENRKSLIKIGSDYRCTLPKNLREDADIRIGDFCTIKIKKVEFEEVAAE